MSIVLLLLLITYGLLVGVLIISLLPEPSVMSVEQAMPGVSVIIPFRNEAPNLDALLTSLCAQEYHGEYEILLVNDGSTDDYLPIIQKHQAEKPIVKVIDSTYSPHKNLSSKQQALDQGVSAAIYDWLAFTDADMILGKRWLSSLVTSGMQGADLVFGHTDITLSANTGWKRWFDILQRFQLDFLFATAYAFNRAHMSGSCMGNNLLVKKESLRSFGGFARLGYSIVEDRDLVQEFHKRGLQIRATEPFSPLAQSFPVESISQFMDQMLRWARGGFNFKSNLLPIGILLSLQNFTFLLSLFGLIPILPALASVVNMTLTVIFCQLGFGRIHSKNSVLLFPLFYLFLIAETILFIPAFFIRPKLAWKGRKL